MDKARPGIWRLLNIVELIDFKSNNLPSYRTLVGFPTRMNLKQQLVLLLHWNVNVASIEHQLLLQITVDKKNSCQQFLKDRADPLPQISVAPQG